MAISKQKKSITPRVVTELHHLKNNFIYGAYLLVVQDFELEEDDRETTALRINITKKHYETYIVPLEKQYGSQAKAVKAIFQFLEKHPEFQSHTVEIP